MADHQNFVLNISVLFRNIQKYFDRMLDPYDIGAGQLLSLIFIHENEGTTMQEVTRECEVDKGTTTKGIQRLIDQGYVMTRTDEKDRRIKRLFTTEKTAAVMHDIYELRGQCLNALAEGVDFEAFEETLEKVCENSRTKLAAETHYEGIRIGGLQRMTLYDYPDKVACTVFLAGCNLKCPYCFNRNYVFIPDNFEYIEPEEIFAYLQKRVGRLDAVCITGGEPLVQRELEPFLREIKNLGYLVKLDTNGCYPERMKNLFEEGLVDYIALDVKNVPGKYDETTGMNEGIFPADALKESVRWLLEGHVDYEIRTTVVRELHTEEDILAIAGTIRGTKRYCLQQYRDTGDLIQKGFSAYSKKEMIQILEKVREIIPAAVLRGINEES